MIQAIATSGPNRLVIDRNLERLWIALVLGASVGAAIWVHQSAPLFRLGQTWEEDSLFQIVARNISARGPLTDLFLDNYALGSDPAAQPFYYTHFPTFAGVLQWMLGIFGGLGAAKGLVIGLFAAGQLYCYLFLRRIFPPAVAVVAFTASALNFPGTIAWADSTVHGLHWLVTFGALYHFDGFLAQQTATPRRRQLYIAMFFFALALLLTLIHALVVAVASIYLCWQHGVRGRVVGAATFLATPAFCMLLHFARVAYLIGPSGFIYDLFHNMLKASNTTSVEQLVDAYRQMGIVVWPTDFPGFSRIGLYGKILDLTSLEVGLVGSVLFGITALFGLVAIAIRLVRPGPSVGSHPALYAIDAFAPFPFLIGGLITWAVIFPVHTANYFNATPRMFVMFYAAVAAGLLTYLVSWGLKNCSTRLSSLGPATAILLLGLWLGSVWGRGYENAEFIAVPGISALADYRGKSFYTNSWPFLVSYYTHEWAIGGLAPQDAAKRDYLKARYLMQRDYRDTDKYGQPEYYLWVSDYRFAPFSEIDPARYKLDLVQKGDGWGIYKINRPEASVP
jgi:hypothetical protein